MKTTKLDKEIEQIYYKNAYGTQIKIMNISKIFDAGRQAALKGEPIELAVVEAIAKYKAN